MIVIFNRIIPFKGFLACNIFGVIFIRKEYEALTNKSTFRKVLNHEAIHTQQMKELGYIGFYVIYFIEWLYRLITPPWKTAYRDISFEQEAYTHSENFEYPSNRKPFAQWRKQY